MDWLTARSTPAVIEIGVIASTIRSYMRPWPLFVAHSLGWTHLWEEYASSEPIPPDRIEVITPSSPRWPSSLRSSESAGQRAEPALK